MSHRITVDYLRAALAAIEEGRGRFSRDPMTFAENTIEDMKRIARDALNGEWDAMTGEYERKDTAP